jgi:hypothetical protein
MRFAHKKQIKVMEFNIAKYKLDYEESKKLLIERIKAYRKAG